MDALEQAGRRTAAVYPSAMCSGAILFYGSPRVVIGEHRTFREEEEVLRSRDVSRTSGRRVPPPP